MRVVIIDDHEMFLESVSRLLQEDPAIDVVGTALNAEQGIKATRNLKPDVVIIDYCLPDMDAPGVIKVILQVVPQAKLITLTGASVPGALYASMRAGSSAWVRKSRAIQDLRDAVHRVSAGRPVNNDEIQSLPPLDQLVMHAQPVIDLANERIVGFEALIRWQHPEQGLLFPAAFLPLAEVTGFIAEIDKWIWENAARELKKWQKTYPMTPPLWVSVNMSVNDLSSPDLFDSIAGILAQVGIDPADFVVEITESMLLHDTKETADFLGRLKTLGVGMALDDFGTAFSSLSYIRRFPFDHLKLDMSFTSELPHSARGMVLVQEICHLASSMKMKSVAEGIERSEQADALREIGCDYGQGYLYSRPVSTGEFEMLLKAQDAASA